MVPMKNARSRYGPNHEPADYEGPSGPKGVYPPEPEGSNHGKPMPSVYEREDDDRRGSNRPRRHSFTDEDTRSSYPEGENRSQWSPQSPQDHHYNSTNNFRSGSTPPASRERSHAEQRDRDHASDYGRRRHRSPERRRHDEPDLDENLPPDISDRHYRPRRRSSVDASDGLREQPQVERRRRPNSPPPAHLPERPRMEEPSRSSKPVKIRRPPSSQNQSSYERERERDAPQYNGSAAADHDVAMDDYTGAGPSDIEGDRPRHGGSLLDRLGGVDASRDYQQHTSLKDRVNVPAKRDLDEMDGHNRYPGEATGDQGSTGEDFSSKRAKKRHSKPKRGRPRGAGGASVYP
ncbi:hypothetical protein K435DRAFT_100257 [Dendrothele bispora CBS 962.96]|uniref:Uncharacterized protein n=1 Tax=Dendrothele bispora (strain CBS 962.96) TaxID=1314807 RepID=A0A4S8M3H0_DENBC|nr:hypothetical protein K435DRAFT_100257 [Dendrothele bispora CBS 962.96]